MSLRGVFFDLYGTLLLYGDNEAAWRDWVAVFDEVLARHGARVDARQLDEQFKGFFAQPEPLPQDDGLTVYERRLRRLLLQLGFDFETPVLKELARKSAEQWCLHTRLDPDALPILEATRRAGHATALISNFDHPPHVHRVLDEMKLRPCFDSVVVSGEVGCKKPDPRIFSYSLEATGLLPHEVLYVGDTEDDVNGALAAGIRPVLISRPGMPSASSDYREESGRPAVVDFAKLAQDATLAGTALSGEATVITSLAALQDLYAE